MYQPYHRKKVTSAAIFFALVLVVLVSLLPVSSALVSAQGPAPTPNPDLVVASGLWPRALGYDGANIWIANGFDNTVLRVDGKTNKAVGDPIAVGQMPSGLAYDSVNKRMWVTNFESNSITLINADGTVFKTVNSGGSGPLAIEDAGGFMWVINQKSDRLNRYDAVSGDSKDSFPVSKTISDGKIGSFPTALKYNPKTQTLWVALGNEDSISIIDARTGNIVGSIPVGGFPIAMAFDGIDMWVVHYDDTVLRFDANSAQPKGKQPFVKLPDSQRSVNLVYGEGRLWVVNGHDGTATDLLAEGSGFSIGSVGEYSGAAIVAGGYLYVASWLQNQVVRIKLDPVGPTRTPTNTPVATKTPLPTNTPDACSGLMTPRLKIGDKGHVTPDDPTPVNVRPQPGTSTEVPGNDPLTQLTAGQTFSVLDGPVCLGPRVWWRVKADKNGKEGWLAESDRTQGKYLVGPGVKE